MISFKINQVKSIDPWVTSDVALFLGGLVT